MLERRVFTFALERGATDWYIKMLGGEFFIGIEKLRVHLIR